MGRLPRDDESCGNFLLPSRVSYSETTVNDDAQLISQALAGQTAAFGQLVEKYQDRLYNTVVHVAGNAEDAKDVVQEAFVQAFLKLESFQGASTVLHMAVPHRLQRGGHLLPPTGGHAIGRTYRLRRRAHLRNSDQGDPQDASDGPSERLEREERRRQVRHAISQLAEEHRVVLVLREMDGCCYETIAEILDLPLGTVRSRLHRARMQLREQLWEVLAVEE